MTGALIIPYQWLMLYISDLVGIHVGNTQQIRQLIHLLLLQLTLVDHDGVVQVTTLDQVGIQQGDDITYEDEGSCRGNLLGVVLHVIKRSKLTADKLRLEGAHGCDREVLIRKDGDARTAGLIFHLYLMTDDIVVFRSVLLYHADLLNLLDIGNGRTIENGELRTVHLYQTVVNT